MLKVGDYRVVDRSLGELKGQVPAEVIEELNRKDSKGKFIVKGRKFSTDQTFEDALNTIKQELAEDVKQTQADLARLRSEEKALQWQLGQPKEVAAHPWIDPEHLKRHRKDLEKALEQAEKDEKALSEAKIATPPLSFMESLRSSVENFFGGRRELPSGFAEALENAERADCRLWSRQSPVSFAAPAFPDRPCSVPR